MGSIGSPKRRRASVVQAALRLRLILEQGDASLLWLPGSVKLRSTATSSSYPSGLAWGALTFILALTLFCGLYTDITRTVVTSFSRHSQCIVESPDWLQRAVRTPEDCSICVGLESVERISNMSPEIFENQYGYSGRPVVVTDAMINWTAPHVFSFEFFKELYENSPQPHCQFFPYKTSFTSLQHLFNVSLPPSWYVGWSNCDDRVARELRDHYSRPYFLPATAENKQLDWIFMGTPGYGAHMHVDNVGHASWQAQLKGSKVWILQPPPECLYVCSTIHVTVQQGDIIVLDTNRWYHQTKIISEELSITIGAEYD